jgi:hypothetical protein
MLKNERQFQMPSTTHNDGLWRKNTNKKMHHGPCGLIHDDDDDAPPTACGEEEDKPLNKEDLATCCLHNFVLVSGSPNKRTIIQILPMRCVCLCDGNVLGMDVGGVEVTFGFTKG